MGILPRYGGCRPERGYGRSTLLISNAGPNRVSITPTEAKPQDK
jgi:hypothetical protein